MGTPSDGLDTPRSVGGPSLSLPYDELLLTEHDEGVYYREKVRASHSRFALIPAEATDHH